MIVFVIVVIYLKIPYTLLELVASVLHILEEVETGTARTQQYARTRLSHLEAFVNTVLHALHVSNRNAEAVESSMQLRVIDTEEHQADTLFSHQIEDVGIVVALVLTTQNQYRRLLHAL